MSTYSVENLEPWLLPYIPDGGKHAVDVGANEGSWSRLLAERFSVVHSFEPQPQLRATCLSSLPSNCRLYEYALTNTMETEPFDVEFYLFNKNVHGSFFPGSQQSDRDEDDRGPQKETITVKATSLDALHFDAVPVSFMKIDVEGAEVDVLKGAAYTILSNRPALMVECHSDKLRDECMHFLGQWPYWMTPIPHPSPDAGPEHSWISAQM